MADNSEIRYLNPIDIEVKKSKYYRFKKSELNLDYKVDFLMKFINEQEATSRRITGTSKEISESISSS